MKGNEIKGEAGRQYSDGCGEDGSISMKGVSKRVGEIKLEDERGTRGKVDRVNSCHESIMRGRL